MVLSEHADWGVGGGDHVRWWVPGAIFDVEDGMEVFGSGGGGDSGAVELLGGRWWSLLLHG